MKKLIALAMSALLLLGLSACLYAAAPEEDAAGTDSTDTSAQSTSEEEAGTAGDTADTTDPADAAESDAQSAPEAEGGVLIVYFSATGNTETAANYIAEATGGDLFALEPAEPYTDEDLNYNDENSRVVYEHEHPEEQAVELVADTVDNWDSYDTVFLGYPIWWQEAAWPVNGFIEANDFTGKTVIPFCTSGSSALGDSAALLEEMAGTGTWLEGQRFSSSVSQDEVQTWLEGLDF